MRIIAAGDRQRLATTTRLAVDVVRPLAQAASEVRAVAATLGGEATEALNVVLQQVTIAADEIIGLVAGVPPARLGAGRLVDAVASLAERSPVPVTVTASPTAAAVGLHVGDHAPRRRVAVPARAVQALGAARHLHRPGALRQQCDTGTVGGSGPRVGTGHGPRAIVACPPDELHDLPLLIFGIVLNRSGWRVGYFGASTPVEELVQEAGRSRPELVVVAATTTDRFTAIRTGLARLAAVAQLALAGDGATQRLADEIGARLLTDDPVTAAQREGLSW